MREFTAEALEAIAKARHGELVEEHAGARIERMKLGRYTTLRAFLPSFGKGGELHVGVDYQGDLEFEALKYLRGKIDEVMGGESA